MSGKLSRGIERRKREADFGERNFQTSID